MKGNALRTDHCGLLEAHLPLQLIENGANLRNLDRAKALNNSSAKQMRHHQVAARTGADRLLGLGLLLVA